MSTSTGPRVIGSEGLYARELALQARTRQIGFRLLAVLTPVLAPAAAGVLLLGLIPQVTGWTKTGVIAGLVLVAAAAPRYFTGKAAALDKGRGQATVGADAEQMVVAALRDNSDIAYVLNGRQLSRTSREDVDQILLLKSGAVCLVETKQRSGVVAVVGGRLVSGKAQRPFHGDPLAQVTRGARNVEQTLGALPVAPVHRIICVAKASNREVFEQDGIRICSARTLNAALAGLAPTVPADKVGTAKVLLNRR
ncbi:nuclease-related domain-containing protein [Modestobacter sp. KNN46-3]|uniref:nuclease-related domain-containing protein n=1 Tax=Modestobacter sp. KNN46-3 TaxID=2711218 RepID=UPI0013E0BF42|nr:nuclease-related domain-containing protein [Modestobacter sp. KNN46-3]